VDKEDDYSDYFGHNRSISSVLSLFCGFLFTSIIIILTAYRSTGEVFFQATLFFLTFTFYVALYTLIGNLEMGFHYIKDIPPLTLKVAPFFRLVLVFYLFGTALVMMFLLYTLFGLALASGIIWVMFVLMSIRSIIFPFLRQSQEREWVKK
jgi:hypothetical protein